MGVLAEMQELAERLVDDGIFNDGNTSTCYFRVRDAKGGLFVILAQPEHQFIACGNALGKRRVRKGRDRVRKQLGRRLGPLDQWAEQGAVHFVQLIEHDDPLIQDVQIVFPIPCFCNAANTICRNLREAKSVDCLPRQNG